MSAHDVTCADAGCLSSVGHNLMRTDMLRGMVYVKVKDANSQTVLNNALPDCGASVCVGCILGDD